MEPTEPKPGRIRAALRWIGVKLLPVQYAFEHPWDAFKALLSKVWRFLKEAFDFIREHTRWMTRRFWVITTWVVLGLLVGVILIYSAVFSFIEAQLAIAPPVDGVYVIGQGWGKAPDSPDRQLYYFTPQGTYLKNLRYEWLVALERPWKKTRFATPENMRSYGFIVEPTTMDVNPGNLPIGFAPRYDAGFGEMMLDISCAACHTGELEYIKDGKRIGVRVDGGPAMHDLTSTRLGHFLTDLLFSMIATDINPFKWQRFCANILGEQNTPAARILLLYNFHAVLDDLLRQAWTDQKLHLYPVEEGYGRTDALGRISNNVFGTNLSEANYRVANAPVSYPPLWDIYKFDWVQYTGSVKQPMARNIGESMGTGARYFLLDPYKRVLPKEQRYEASTKVLNLHEIERTLRKLEPPCWPADVFGSIDMMRAQKGHDLFNLHCASCHAPKQADENLVELDAPSKIGIVRWLQRMGLDQDTLQKVGVSPEQLLKVQASSKDSTDYSTIAHWIMTMLPVEDIGTDPATALNFVRHRVDLSATGMAAGEVRKALEPFQAISYQRQKKYYTALMNLYKSQPSGVNSPMYQQAAAAYQHLNGETLDDYSREQFADMNLSSVSIGAGLNYIITFIREQAYRDLDITGFERGEFDGFDQIDTPQVVAKYKARPLAGAWATAPYLHNGSVPTLYEMLLPAHERRKTFVMQGRTFDPIRVGLVADGSQRGGFVFDTSIPGNWNTGHEFRAGYRPWQEGAPPAYGVIGPELTDDERWAIIEYLKIRRDDPSQSCPVTLPNEYPAAKPATGVHP